MSMDVNINDYVEYKGDDLFNDVFEFKKQHGIQGYSIFQVILMFCDEHDYHVEEIGDMLRVNKQFREMIKADLKLNNEAIFSDDKKISALNDWT